MNSLLPCLKTEIQNHKPANEYVKYDKLKVIRNLVTWKHKHRCFKLFLAFAHLFSLSLSLSEIEKEISHFQFALHFGSVLFSLASLIREQCANILVYMSRLCHTINACKWKYTKQTTDIKKRTHGFFGGKEDIARFWNFGERRIECALFFSFTSATFLKETLKFACW